MPNIRFAVGLTKLLPFLGFHHVLMIFIALAIILLCESQHPVEETPTQHGTSTDHFRKTALLLAGCSSSSPAIPNIFLISFFYQMYAPNYDPTQVDPGVSAAIANIVGRASLEVRVGYFGICINNDGGSFLCSNNATLLAEQLSIEEDPLNLIYVANTFKNSVVFPYLM
jgi:hypothetical protein